MAKSYICSKIDSSLHLNRLILTNFKNYAFEQLDFHAGLNCIVGMNGMGKTNLLDAIYYACMGKSYFGVNDRDIVRQDSDFFRLEAHFEREKKGEKIVVKVMPRKKKILERNDVAYAKISEHVGLLPVVIIAPDDTRIATEGSEGRRRFLDNTLSQIDQQYLRMLIRYNHILKQRNAALKQFGEHRKTDPTLLKIYDDQLIEPGVHLHQKRTAFLEDFGPELAQTYQLISGEQEQVSCRYQSALSDRDFQQILLDAREKDLILQRTTAGPHRDDLDFRIEGRPVKRFASQGQLKSVILSLKLAQYKILKMKKKLAPILLLDDIFDKLDTERIKHLIQLLVKDEYGQIFITDTHKDRVSEIVTKSGASHQQFAIESGTAKSTH